MNKLKIAKTSLFSKRGLVMSGLIFGLIGLGLQINSMAATSYGIIEAESAAKSGNVQTIADSGASGGSAVEFNTPPVNPNPPVVPNPNPPTTPSDYLAFDMPTTAALRASNKKVFAHYIPAFPVSLDNGVPTNDYYANYWMKPAIEGPTDHRAHGGYLRDRKITRAPIAVNFGLEDAKTEVRQAIAAGLDGFAIDILTVNNDRFWGLAKNIVAAADSVDPGFKILLMPDALTLRSVPDATLADALGPVAKSPSIYRLPDGRVVISTFMAELRTPQSWQNIFNIMETKYGVKVAFFPALNVASTISSYYPMSIGVGNWGHRSPTTGSAEYNTSLRTHAQANGKMWMQPVSMQDNRPLDGVYWEARNTENLRLTWQSAFDGADWVQLATWDDYKENSHFSPSMANGWNTLDLNAYYLVRFKTGAFPTIKRDTIYTIHRTQLSYTPQTYPQTRLMNPSSGSVPPSNNVEFITFLTAASQVNARIGSKTYTYNAPAGYHVQTYPAEYGSVSATIVRSNITLNSKHQISSSPYNQNLNYIVSGSRR